MSASRAQPKGRFSSRTPNGDYLSLTVWPGKTDPAAEVLTVQLRRQSGQGWETVGRLAVYRTSDGRYSLLPERQLVSGTAKADSASSSPTEQDSEE